MWALKIRIREKWNIYNERCVRFKIKIYFYSLNNYKKGKYIYIVGSGIVQGEEKNKNSFFKSLRQDKKIVKLERNKDFFICIYKETEKIAKERGIDLGYDPAIIHLKPVIFDEQGWEEWEIASPERKIFEKVLSNKRINKEFEAKILYFKNKKIESIMPLTMLPKLTKKQEQAITLASKKGYYESPRDIDLIHLAKLSNLSLSTFQVHLRKAEKKLLPFILKKYKESESSEK